MRTKPLDKYYTPICVSAFKQDEAINYVFNSLTSLIKQTNPNNLLVVYKDWEEAEEQAKGSAKEGMVISTVTICQYLNKIVFCCFGRTKEIAIENFFENFCEVFE